MDGMLNHLFKKTACLVTKGNFKKKIKGKLLVKVYVSQGNRQSKQVDETFITFPAQGKLNGWDINGKLNKQS